jgi:hypothetical protein
MTEVKVKCRFCTGVLDPVELDDMTNKICSSCLKQPEGLRFMALLSKPVAGAMKPKIVENSMSPTDR